MHEEVAILWKRERAVPKDLIRQIDQARALYDDEQYERAEALIRALLPLCDDAVGSDHREAIGLRNVLGSVLYQQRELVGSALLHREAMELGIGSLGRNDRLTLSCAHNYAAALAVMGRTDESIEILRDTLRRRTRKLGAHHEETLLTSNTLGATLFSTGAIGPGIDLLRQAHARSSRLPAAHPLRHDIKNNLEIALRNSGPRW
ncbi:tetratricopeptide repeat protein [Nonomuraea sp. NPDC049504]|uniref:tetratricopeptide repeat protein n=1 Tax=Nonomuraea sp. NPDC049504 TaxID=3154729 RepID=UPI00342E0FA1